MKRTIYLLLPLALLLHLFSTSYGQSIVATDFNREQVWFKDYRAAEKWVDLSATTSNPALSATATWGKFGMIDVANTTIASDGLRLLVDNTSGQKNWTASLNSGLLAVKNTETNLAKLTLSFDHAVSSVRPVVVRIESFDALKKRTGGLETTLYPAAANHFLRSAIELATMKVSGEGKFNPQDPYIQASFQIADHDLVGKQELRIDNFCYAFPAYYVSPTGKDSNDGRTEKTAFANPQAALNVAKPGNIILLMNGNYSGAKEQPAVACFISSGTPAAWITLKNYPGHKPVILCHGKDGVLLAQGNARTYTNSPILAYIEIRGLILQGNSEEVLKQKHPDLSASTPITETTGININGSFSPTRMYHHIRVADCTAEYCGADGVYVDFTDYFTLENCILRNNCYTSVHWLMSGFSMLHYADFDKVDNATKCLIRNNQAYGNQCKTYKTSGPFKIYNGNGFIFDASWEEYLAPDAYLGRTLVQNNLVYGNGGGGIQMWGAHRIDVVNNTMYHNGITPELKWGNMGFDHCDDIRVVNNIVVAQPDRPLDFWETSHADKSSNIVRVNNLYFGGIRPNIKGEGDIVADPLFVNPSLDPSVADFRLKPPSPAIHLGYHSTLNGIENRSQNTAKPTSALDDLAKDSAAIRRHRMGTITVQTAPNATVRVEQLRHEFSFGSSITSSAFNGRMSAQDSARFRQTFLANFNSGVTENALKWPSMEPKRGQINYQIVDHMLTWADANKIPLRGHNIYWGIEKFVPDWVKQLDTTELRQVLEQRARAVASRYRGRFVEYDLNNEMIHGNLFSERLGSQITLEMAKWVKSEDPSAQLFLNDYDITTGRMLKQYVAHIRELLAMGVPIAGIGAQGHLHGQTFDRAALRNALDELAQFKLPVRITEFNMPGQKSKFYEHPELVLTPDEELEKAQEMTDFLRTCFAHPAVEGILFWGFWEGANWIQQSSLFKRDWTPTPAGLAYRDLVFKQWWTKWEGKADKNGRCEIPAFFGTYRVSSGSRIQTVELLKKLGSVTVMVKK